jgi:hypothetical protein
MFSDWVVLKNYVFPETIIPETMLIFAYFAFFIAVDFLFDISSVIRSCFNGQAIVRLADSPMFMAVYISAAIVATILQVVMMAEYGSVFTGDYVTSGYGLIPFWGFLAGLYEVIFLCFVLFLLSSHRHKYRLIIIGIYVVTAALRVSGGTRLILIKELAVICILLYMRGQMKRSRLVLVASIVIVLGSVVGYFRQNGQIGENAFGPLYGVAMESGLDALTLNVAYQVQSSGYVAEHGDIFSTLEFVALSAIPSFLRVGVTQQDLDNLSPYDQAYSEFDTSAPVGGMSGFATLCYLSSYPLLSVLTLVLILSLLIKWAPQGALKQIFVVVMSINAIHFWRDPVDIAVKNAVQDAVCALALLYIPAFLYIPAAYRVLKAGRSRSTMRGDEWISTI